jgi:hypothetical protein
LRGCAQPDVAEAEWLLAVAEDQPFVRRERLDLEG